MATLTKNDTLEKEENRKHSSKTVIMDFYFSLRCVFRHGANLRLRWTKQLQLHTTSESEIIDGLLHLKMVVYYDPFTLLICCCYHCVCFCAGTDEFEKSTKKTIAKNAIRCAILYVVAAQMCWQPEKWVQHVKLYTYGDEYMHPYPSCIAIPCGKE